MTFDLTQLLTKSVLSKDKKIKRERKREREREKEKF
jgi:hypothetical protein